MRSIIHTFHSNLLGLILVTKREIHLTYNPNWALIVASLKKVTMNLMHRCQALYREAGPLQRVRARSYGH